VANKRKECVHFGAAVRRLREGQGYSQESFADKVRVHRTYLGGIERGERNPTLTTIHRVADALRVPVWQLFRGAEDTE
jgi:transcriptional regulator with XRE-family HTH domain